MVLKMVNNTAKQDQSHFNLILVMSTDRIYETHRVLKVSDLHQVNGVQKGKQFLWGIHDESVFEL